MKKIKKVVPHIIKRLLLVAVFLTIGAALIVYARGYRLDPEQKILVSHGIVSVSASPNAARVYVNGEFKGVTDLNLTLPSGQYTIEVKKDGYTTWTRSIRLKGELVVTLDVLLYPLNPSLTPLTNLGVVKAVPIEKTGKLLVFTNSGDEEKDGIYLFEPTNSPISFFTPLKLLLTKKSLPEIIDFKLTTVTFSPDLKQASIDFYQEDKLYISYLISLEEENKQLFDVTTSKEALITAWNEQRKKDMERIVEAFPKELRKVASDSMHIVAFSEDETKVLYQAKTEFELPAVITPPLISPNQTAEKRITVPLYLYVYDKKEDRNYLVMSDADWIRHFVSGTILASTRPATDDPEETFEQTYIYWHPDSKHLILNEGPRIVAMSYDGQDKQPIYSGPFDQSFFSISQGGNPVVITNLNPQNNLNPDLYMIGIK